MNRFLALLALAVMLATASLAANAGRRTAQGGETATLEATSVLR
jgi:hypothetical protein